MTKLFKLLTFSLSLGLAACADQSSRSIESQLEAAGFGLQGGEPVSKSTNSTVRQVKSVVAMIKQEGYKPHCGGVFISSRLVLTAAHCLFDGDTNDWIPLNSLKVATCVDDNATACNWISTKSYIVHEEYFQLHPELVTEYAKLGAPKNPPLKSSHGDLAIVLIDKSVATKKFVSIATETPKTGDELSVFGSGRINKNAKLDKIMRTAKFSADRISNYTADGKDFEGRYLAMHTSEKGVCFGDSGSPIFYHQEKKLVLSAINIMLMTASVDHACGAKAMIVIDLSKYAGWIQGKSEALLGGSQAVQNLK